MSVGKPGAVACRRTFKDGPLGLGRSLDGRVDQEKIWERMFGLISAHPFLMTAEGRDEPTKSTPSLDKLASKLFRASLPPTFVVMKTSSRFPPHFLRASPTVSSFEYTAGHRILVSAHRKAGLAV